MHVAWHLIGTVLCRLSAACATCSSRASALTTGRCKSISAVKLVVRPRARAAQRFCCPRPPRGSHHGMWLRNSDPSLKPAHQRRRPAWLLRRLQPQRPGVLYVPARCSSCAAFCSAALAAAFGSPPPICCSCEGSMPSMAHPERRACCASKTAQQFTLKKKKKLPGINFAPVCLYGPYSVCAVGSIAAAGPRAICWQAAHCARTHPPTPRARDAPLSHGGVHPRSVQEPRAGARPALALCVRGCLARLPRRTRAVRWLSPVPIAAGPWLCAGPADGVCLRASADGRPQTLPTAAFGEVVPSAALPSRWRDAGRAGGRGAGKSGGGGC